MYYRTSTYLCEFGFRLACSTYYSASLCRCYRKDDVNVVVDVTDWGYRVGEIEVVVSSKEEVPAAVAKIEHLAKQMGEQDAVF